MLNVEYMCPPVSTGGCGRGGFLKDNMPTEKAQHEQRSEGWQRIRVKCFNHSFLPTLFYRFLSCPSVTKSFISSGKMIRSAF